MEAGAEAVDDYIAGFAPDVRAELARFRVQIRAALPEASEGISYGMPTFYLDGRYLVYLAAWKRHISLYPVPACDDALERDLAPFRAGKGTLRFPIGGAIPEGLVGRIVQALVGQRGP